MSDYPELRLKVSSKMEAIAAQDALLEAGYQPSQGQPYDIVVILQRKYLTTSRYGWYTAASRVDESTLNTYDEFFQTCWELAQEKNRKKGLH